MRKKTSPKFRKRKTETVISYCQPDGEIVLYQSTDGHVQLEVRLVHDTIWLNLNQIAALFDRDKSVISRHINNIYEEGELNRETTVAFFATVQQEGTRKVTRQVEYYNLDTIISVGYRVNSIRGTQFRIWATGILRDHLVKGYTANAQRLATLQKSIRLISNVFEQRSINSDEAAAILRVLQDYSEALNILDAYDHGNIPQPERGFTKTKSLNLSEARQVITTLREHFGGSALFGRENGNRLESSIAAVFQTADGHELYPSIEEKAAHLLYFVVKNHPFVDGNKRIGAALFLRFLEKNSELYLRNGEPRLSHEALVALTLLIAESPAKDKDTIVQLITYLLQKRKIDNGAVEK